MQETTDHIPKAPSDTRKQCNDLPGHENSTETTAVMEYKLDQAEHQTEERGTPSTTQGIAKEI